MEVKLVKKDSFRSEGRKINESDDMYRIVIDIKMIDYYRLIMLIDENKADKCEWEKEDKHFTNPHNGHKTYDVGKYCPDCGKQLKII
jgi:hypothetical protein